MIFYLLNSYSQYLLWNRNSEDKLPVLETLWFFFLSNVDFSNWKGKKTQSYHGNYPVNEAGDGKKHLALKNLSARDELVCAKTY